MPIDELLRRKPVKKIYGDPPESTFAHRIKNGDVPPPDAMLGPQTPAWFRSTIERDLEAKAKRGYRPFHQRRRR